eukprot:826770-Pelagomonas_calceolata.AAC.9
MGEQGGAERKEGRKEEEKLRRQTLPTLIEEKETHWHGDAGGYARDEQKNCADQKGCESRQAFLYMSHCTHVTICFCLEGKSNQTVLSKPMCNSLHSPLGVPLPAAFLLQLALEHITYDAQSTIPALHKAHSPP